MRPPFRERPSRLQKSLLLGAMENVSRYWEGAVSICFTAASRTPPWLPSGWGCRGRRLSREQGSPDTLHGLWVYRLGERRREPGQDGRARRLASSLQRRDDR